MYLILSKRTRAGAACGSPTHSDDRSQLRFGTGQHRWPVEQPDKPKERHQTNWHPHQV